MTSLRALRMATTGLLVAVFGPWGCGQLIGIADVSDDGTDAGDGAEGSADVTTPVPDAADAGAIDADGAGSSVDAGIDGVGADAGPTFCTMHSGHTRCIDFEVANLGDVVVATNVGGGTAGLDLAVVHSDAKSLLAFVPKDQLNAQQGGAILIVPAVDRRKLTVDFWATFDDVTAGDVVRQGPISLFDFRMNAAAGEGIRIGTDVDSFGPVWVTRIGGQSPIRWLGGAVDPPPHTWNHYVFTIVFATGTGGSVAIKLNGVDAPGATGVATTAQTAPMTMEVGFIVASPGPLHPVNLRVDDVLIDVE